MGQKRPRRVADAQAVDRLTAVWDVGRRVDESADIAAPAGGVGDHEPAVGVSDQDLVSNDVATLVRPGGRLKVRAPRERSWDPGGALTPGEKCPERLRRV
jgi:hypothetical protein